MSALALAVISALTAGYENNIEVMGFSKDGRYLVYSSLAEDHDDWFNQVTAKDLLTGQVQTFRDGKEAGFLKAHPLVDAIAGRTSPDGKATAEVVAEEMKGGGVWSTDRWRLGRESAWHLSVARDGRTTKVAELSPGNYLDVYWSPDGKFTAWVAVTNSRGMRDPGFQEIVVGTDGRPSIALVMDKDNVKAGLLKLAQTVTKAGFAVVSSGSASKPREKSVVFAAEGLEEQAKALAAVVPGGATVEKLTWKAAARLVVYAGPEAFK